MTRTCKLPLGLAALTLLAGCAAPLPPPPPASPAPSAAALHQTEQRAYASGYAAGRRYQKQQDAAPTPDAPSPAPVVDAAPPAPTAAAGLVPAAAAAPPRPAPPPVDGYAVQGAAKPIISPAN